MKESNVTFLIGIFTGLILGASIAAAIMVQRYNGGFWVDCKIVESNPQYPVLKEMCAEHKKQKIMIR